MGVDCALNCWLLAASLVSIMLTASWRAKELEKVHDRQYLLKSKEMLFDAFINKRLPSTFTISLVHVNLLHMFSSYNICQPLQTPPSASSFSFLLVHLPGSDRGFSTQWSSVFLTLILRYYDVAIDNDRSFPIMRIVLAWSQRGWSPAGCRTCTCEVRCGREHVCEEVLDCVGEVVAGHVVVWMW